MDRDKWIAGAKGGEEQTRECPFLCLCLCLCLCVSYLATLFRRYLTSLSSLVAAAQSLSPKRESRAETLSQAHFP